MTGDISARRGALPINNQRRLTTLKWLMALNYSRGPRGEVTNAKRHRPKPTPEGLTSIFTTLRTPAVTVLPSRRRFPLEPERPPRRSPVRGFSMGRFSIRNLVQKWAAGRARNARSLPRVESEPVVRTGMAPASAQIPLTGNPACSIAAGFLVVRQSTPARAPC